MIFLIVALAAARQFTIFWDATRICSYRVSGSAVGSHPNLPRHDDETGWGKSECGHVVVGGLWGVYVQEVEGLGEGFGDHFGGGWVDGGEEWVGLKL
jgi:hypothetical protein